MLRWASWFRSFSPAELRLLLQPELHDTIASALDPIRAVTAEYAALDPARRMLVTDQLTWLPDNMLIRGDKVLMAASVEGRMPLLDRQIVERLAGLSARARSTLRSPKSLLRSAVADLIPAEIVGGPKRGFTVPVARFLFEDEARTLERLVLSDRTLARGIYQPDALRGLVARDARYGANHELKLFTVAALELWLRTCVDELTTEPPTDLATASSSASDMAVAV
jgi:asparagine synthase (glutamine-hydrolysing)